MILLPDPSAFRKIRLATPEDVLRLGIICTASFRYSEQFIWERPYHAEYPQDTIVFFRHEVRSLIEDPKMIVAVAVDEYDPEESSKTGATIPVDSGWTPPDRGDEVVVGIAVWQLEPGSKRIGHFQSSSRNYPALPKCLHRDENPTRVKIIQKVYEELEHKYFGKVSAMERTAVHPAYWKRGHGSTLAKWGLDLAKIDKVNQAVLATSMGASLFKHMRFKLITEHQIDGGEEDPTGYIIAVREYFVNGGNCSVDFHTLVYRSSCLKENIVGFSPNGHVGLRMHEHEQKLK
ncbi:hypothetical protein DL95DRAFT_510438 [Leptodontidium sp. 2 PMI_412]|nr:hypothetical protein DL95DRAFT_510438 [Leptodontidium sp. 2 PMI_412]